MNRDSERAMVEIKIEDKAIYIAKLCMARPEH
jgi:hypothetical protein